MAILKKVSIFVCFLAMFSFLFLTTAAANNSEKSKGPKWNESPSPPANSEKPEKPEKSEKPEKPEEPNITLPVNQEPLTPPENKGPKGPSGPSGKSKIGHLYLYEKDSTTTNWSIVLDGAWGKMKYPSRGPVFKFVFNGHFLESEKDYTLIYYPDPWPGNGLICLGSGTSDGEGNVHIMGAHDTDDLPLATDLNNPANSGHEACMKDSTCIEGAKIWLVLSSDVDCDSKPTAMIGWNPTEYLFEDIGIFYNKP